MVMEAHVQTIIFTIINFFITFLVLRHFLFKPISKVVNERRTEVTRNLDEAAASKEQAEQFRLESETNLKGSREEGKAIVEDYKKKAEKLSAEVKKKAEEEAREIIDRAIKEAEREKEKARAEIKGEVVALALALSAKALEKHLDDSEQRRLMDEFISKVGN